jgi:hypothetical protein
MAAADATAAAQGSGRAAVAAGVGGHAPAFPAAAVRIFLAGCRDLPAVRSTARSPQSNIGPNRARQAVNYRSAPTLTLSLTR